MAPSPPTCSASVLALSGQGSASLTAPPLLLTAVLVGLLALLTVRSERSNRSAAWPVAVGRIVLGAAGYAVVWALLGVLVRGQIGFGTAGALGKSARPTSASASGACSGMAC